MSDRLRIIGRLALRNLRRHLRRTLLTASAMVVGGAFLMIALPLGDGTHEAWIESAVRMGSGHLTLQHPRFLSERKLKHRVPGQLRARTAAALDEPAVRERWVGVAPRLAISGLASSPTGARPVEVIGVDPEAEAAFSILDDKLAEGRYLQPGDRLAAYVGAELAESLKLRLGSRLVVTAQDADGEIAGQLVRVVGVFHSGVPEIDAALIHIPLATAGAWLGTGDAVTGLAVLAADSEDVGVLQRALRTALYEPLAAGALSVMDWREAMPALDAAVRIDDFGNYLFHGILFTIIGLGIVNTVLMSVMHRHREFGVLQALGLTPRQTGGLVMIEGLVLTLVSGAIGVAAGMAITWLLWRDGLDLSGMWSEEWTFSGVVMDPVVIPVFRVARVVQALVFVVLIGALASVYPAWRAARIDVTEAMKFER